MALQRASGANVKSAFGWESSYGGGATDFVKLPVIAFGLSEKQPVEEEPELGQGRDGADPGRGEINDTGQLRAYLDNAGAGLLLRLLLGEAASVAAVAATGTITFADNPTAGQTVTVNGTTWTFVDSAASTGETNIQGTLAGTLTQLASDLNGSADTDIDDATYDATTTALTVVHDTAGPDGNAFTLSASAATVSAGTLTGGGWLHTFASGAEELPSAAMAAGVDAMAEPTHSLHTGCLADNLTVERRGTGSAEASLALIAQAEVSLDAAPDADPTAFAGRTKFRNFRGQVTLASGQDVGTITGFAFTYSNNLDVVRGQDRDDGRISGADPGQTTATGSVTVRFENRYLLTKATADEPVDLVYSLTHPSGQYLTFTFPRVHLPRPDRPIEGPGGIEQTFEFVAAPDLDAGDPKMTVELLTTASDDFSAVPS